jgi:hypothetical protein
LFLEEEVLFYKTRGVTREFFYALLKRVEPEWGTRTLATNQTRGGLTLTPKSRTGRARLLSAEQALSSLFIWLYRYVCPEVQRLHLNGVSARTIQKAILTMLVICHKIFKLQPPTKEEIEADAVYFRGRRIVGVIDGSEQNINGSSVKFLDDATFSGKKKHNTFTGLTIVSPYGVPLYRASSQPGTKVDVVLARSMEMRQNFYDLLGPNDYLMGDKGFYGMETAFPRLVIPFKKNKRPFLEPHEREFNHEMDRIRIVVENHFSHLKDFAVCSLPFRVDHFHLFDCLNLHQIVWELVTGLIKTLRGRLRHPSFFGEAALLSPSYS